MPVQATPVATPASTRVVTSEELRAFLRDYTNNNPLLDSVEFSDSEMATAVDRAVDLANMVDRPTGWTVTDFPNKTLLLMGSAAHLLLSESFRQIRNDAKYQDGNIQPVNLDGNSQGYASMAQALRVEFKQHVSQIKISENMNATSGIGSPLRYSDRRWRG